MKFGVREICDVVLRAKNRMKVGNKFFYRHEPVIYFDTLKTSSMEGAATQVYAQGGRGNPRLIAWEGERTVTFTMEDALISAEGFMILSGAGLIEATESKPLYQHMTETVDASEAVVGEDGVVTINLSEKPYLPATKGDNFAYVMFKRDGEIVTEPYIPVHGIAGELDKVSQTEISQDNAGVVEITDEATGEKKYQIRVISHSCYDDSHDEDVSYAAGQIDEIKYDSVLVDFYVERIGATKQIEITPDQFGGNFYLEASTLFRTENGVDMPAEFIIPNCKIQSNFTFTMASSGDPSSFTFTMDAFPDYTRFDHSKKVLAAIQMIEEDSTVQYHRGATPNGSYAVNGGEDSDVHDDQLGIGESAGG